MDVSIADISYWLCLKNVFRDKSFIIRWAGTARVHLGGQIFCVIYLATWGWGGGGGGE